MLYLVELLPKNPGPTISKSSLTILDYDKLFFKTSGGCLILSKGISSIIKFANS